MFAYFALFLLLASASYATEPLTLEEALTKAFETHPQLGAGNANFEAEKAAVNLSQSPSDPMFGVMYEKNMNLMQQQMGPMTSLSLAQDIEFPAKYYLRGRLQEARALQAKQELAQTRLALRRKVITTYFQLYANQRIKELIEAQKDTVRQVARIAESRHSIGAVTQQDEMKAHVEQSAVENEMFEVRREEEALHARMTLLLGDDLGERLVMSRNGLSLPEARLPNNIADLIVCSSRRIRQADIMFQQAKLQKNLALFDYAPNFRLSARTMVGANSPGNNFAFGVDISLPLWFFMRQNSEVSTAASRVRQSHYELENAKRELLADGQEILAKVRTHQNLIKVFSTTFVPQAESTLNASRNAYEAGRTNFLELLDSARTVFTIRATYFRHIAEYVEQLALLEELTGTSLSSLPFGDSA